MLEIQQVLIKQVRYISLLMSLYLIAWVLTPFKPVFLGLILGTSLSLFNMWLLARKMHKFSANIDAGKKTKSLGMFQRMAMAVIGVMIAMKYPDHVHLISVIIGLMTSYVVIIIDFLLSTIILHSNKKER